MIPDTTIEQLEEAMSAFDQTLRYTDVWKGWEQKENYKYAIKYGGKLYPPKHIIYLATKAPTHTFSGGDETNDFLRKKGLTIIPLNSAQETQMLMRNPIQATLQKILFCYKKYKPGDSIGKNHEIWKLFEEFVRYFRDTKLLNRYPDINLEWSAGIGRLTALPWISFLDIRETDSTQEGIYCVFLFREDMTGLYWTLNQGVTKPKQLYGDQNGRQYLKATALKVRSQAKPLETEKFVIDDGLDLHTKAVRGSDYELSTIAYKFYEIGSIPEDQQLIKDVDTLLNFYTRFIDSQKNPAIETDKQTQVPKNFIENRQVPEQIETVVPQTVSPPYPLDKLASDLLIEKSLVESWINGIERKGQAILYGPPGTGKTFTAEKIAEHLVAESDGFTEIVQFHPAYAYEDFIQGLRPKPRKDGGLDYAIIPGRFLDFCDEATKRKGRCVLIIDEINRANLAKVFGELMYLLEYRNREIPLSNGGSLKVPSNVRIIGTMNTADRSIALVDHALRRRFAFIPLYPFYEVLLRFHEQSEFPTEKFIDFLKKLNKDVGDRHYEIGISFFLKRDLLEHLEDIWKMEIEPYLEEYFFDQPDKVELFRWEKLKKKIANESNEPSNN
jgi:hypothetical protein